jgi:hypothetical protein
MIGKTGSWILCTSKIVRPHALVLLVRTIRKTREVSIHCSAPLTVLNGRTGYVVPEARVHL